MTVRTLGAWATAGAALWASMGELDVVAAGQATVRVAMLPPLVLLPVAAALACLIGWLTAMRYGHRDRSDAVLPLYVLAVLLLPYLPWVADLLPGVRVLAGPARYVLWLVVIAQVVWASFGAGRGRRVVVRLRSWSTLRTFTAVALFSVVVYGGVAAVVAVSGLVPGGDEPHYLIITQSLIADHDLDIENNHAQKDYRAYYDQDLDPHALARGVNGRLYSVHPIGLPVLIAPFFALGGYPAVVFAMVLMAALASGLAWTWVRRATGSVSAATFAWAAAALSVSFGFSAGTIYPEVAAALAIALALAVGLTGPTGASDAPTFGRALVVGCAAAALPWLSSKYAPVSAVLVAIAARRVLADTSAPASRPARLAATLVPYVVSLAGWFAFFQVLWGSPWPSAAYGGADQTQMSVANLLRGVPGLLFDQEYGLLAYTPVLAIAAVGCWHQWRAGGQARVLATELAVAFAALMLTVAGHTMWWGGSSVPARFLVAGIPMLALPVAWEYRRVGQVPDRRAAYRLLLLIGLGAAVAILVSPDASTVWNRRDGVSRLLQWLSPDWHVWAFAPDFIGQQARWGLAQAVLWIACLAGCAWLFSHLFGRTPAGFASRTGRGLAFLRADVGLGLALIIICLSTPPLLGARLKPGPRPADRARVELLQNFDPRARPLAIRYDPFSLVDPASVPASFELVAVRGARRPAQSVPLLLNARFALPAGRYRVELTPVPGASLGGHLALQGGRHGGTLTSWTVTAGSGGRWQDTFDLPVDLSFVGFRASGDLDAVVGEIHLTPVRVLPTLERTAAEDVLGSETLGERFVFLFHDGGSFPEDKGFWVRGASRASVSVVSRTGRLTLPVDLLLRNGPVANVIHIVTPGETIDVRLGPKETKTVRVSPTALDGTLRMAITPETGFVPARTEAGSTDSRLLGCWVEVVG